MCLILFAYQYHRQFPLIIAANRDEFYTRPTEAAKFWPENPEVLGGRDLEKMGTWLGVTKAGRFAAVTNYRNPSLLIDNPQSRGELVSKFLTGHDDPRVYINDIKGKKACYNPFNLLIGDASSCLYYSPITDVVEEIRPGIYGLSNHLLDTPWPKVQKGKEKLAEALQGSDAIRKDKLFAVLADRQRAKNDELPNTGVSLEWEEMLSSIFVESPTYGTRSSTLLLIDKNNNIIFSERTFIPGRSTWNEVIYEISKLS